MSDQVISLKYEKGQHFFVNEKDEQIDVPLGSVLDFFEGYAIRQYGANGDGCYGMPERKFWKVVYTEQDMQPGLLLPSGQDGFCGFFREAQFVPLRLVRPRGRDDPRARIDSVPT